MFRLPAHPQRKYAVVARCIYCSTTVGLADEHIVPFGLGGRWILPNSSCHECATITGAFEQICLRTMLGPLRMYFALPTRRKAQRPKKLPLKVKLTPSSDWSYLEVDQDIYPFLILLPKLGIPEQFTGKITDGDHDAKVQKLWIKAASFRHGILPHLNALASQLRVAAIEPTGTFAAPPFFRLLGKIAHAFAVAEIGVDGFSPFLLPIVRHADTSRSTEFVGGEPATEPPTQELHEISFIPFADNDRALIVVRIRLFAVLGTPTYVVIAGLRL